MGFAFQTTDESVQAGGRRIAREQVDTALNALRSQGRDAGSGVHEARKACKRPRGLLRLLRPSMSVGAPDHGLRAARAGLQADDGLAPGTPGHSGIVAIWARAGAALDTLRETGATPERLHNRCKRVKGRRYPMRLFEATAPDLPGAQSAEAGRRGDLLGEHQDLYPFRAHLADGGLPCDARVAMDGPAVAGMDQP